LRFAPLPAGQGNVCAVNWRMRARSCRRRTRTRAVYHVRVPEAFRC
jgi:hypothetical protein